VPGVVDPGIPDLRLAQDGLPGPPVLGAFDRPAAASGEHQVMVGPRAARLQPLRDLPLPVVPQQPQESGRALKRELALPLALPENDTTARSLRALVRVAGATRWARAPITDVSRPRAARTTRRQVLVLPALRFARPPVPSFAACVRVSASVPSLSALRLEPGPDDAGVQVYV